MTQLTLAAFKDILTQNFPAQDWSGVDDAASLSELGLDSLDKATLFMKVEELAGVVIPDDKYEDMDTAGEIIAFVQSQ